MGIITLLVGALIGCLADLIVPDSLPYGWISAIIAGLVGSWIGGTLLGQWGPTLDGLYIIPSLIGAIVFAFVVDFVRRALARGRTAEALSMPVVPPPFQKSLAAGHAGRRGMRRPEAGFRLGTLGGRSDLQSSILLHCSSGGFRGSRRCLTGSQVP